MWYAFWSVVHDLWLFVIGDVFTNQPVALVSSVQLQSPKQPLQIGTVPDSLPVADTVTRKVAPTILITAPVATPMLPAQTIVAPPVDVIITTAAVHTRLNEPSIMYVSSLTGTVCLREPGGSYDAIITNLPFGTAVTVSAFSGRYAHVLKGNYTGWIMKDDITPHKHDVWPELQTWAMYGAENPVTTKIRALINDEFGAGSLALPLQAGEYILLRLLQDKRSIIWPDGRPRLPGSWQGLLKGTVGIHSTITPRTDTIMEWQTESDGGRLAYVEGVGLDGEITTSCVGLVVAGQYTKQVWGQADWRELRPTFIEVS